MKTAKNQSQSDRVSDFWPMSQKCQDDKNICIFHFFELNFQKKWKISSQKIKSLILNVFSYNIVIPHSENDNI